MVVFILEDMTDTIEAIMFSEKITDETAAAVYDEAMIIVRGKLDDRKKTGNMQCVAESSVTLDTAREKLSSKILVFIDGIGVDKNDLDRIKKIADRNPGDVPVQFKVKTKKHGTVIMSSELKVRASDRLISELETAVGKENLSITGKIRKYA